MGIVLHNEVIMSIGTCIGFIVLCIIITCVVFALQHVLTLRHDKRGMA